MLLFVVYKEETKLFHIIFANLVGCQRSWCSKCDARDQLWSSIWHWRLCSSYWPYRSSWKYWIVNCIFHRHCLMINNKVWVMIWWIFWLNLINKYQNGWRQWIRELIDAIPNITIGCLRGFLHSYIFFFKCLFNIICYLWEKCFFSLMFQNWNIKTVSFIEG